MEALGLQIEVITPARALCLGISGLLCGEVLNIYQFALSQVHGKRLVCICVLFSSRISLQVSNLSCMLQNFSYSTAIVKSKNNQKAAVTVTGDWQPS